MPEPQAPGNETDSPSQSSKQPSASGSSLDRNSSLSDRNSSLDRNSQASGGNTSPKKSPKKTPKKANVDMFHFEAPLPVKRPYHTQGSEHWDDSLMMRKRTAIRKSQNVRKAAMQFWSTAGKSVTDRMGQSEYLSLHGLISRALAPELTSKEARQAAEEDWLEDCCGEDNLSFEKFTHGLTGVADMWTDSVEELARSPGYTRCVHCLHCWGALPAQAIRGLCVLGLRPAQVLSTSPRNPPGLHPRAPAGALRGAPAFWTVPDSAPGVYYCRTTRSSSISYFGGSAGCHCATRCSPRCRAR